MKIIAALAGLMLVSISTVSVEARDRWLHRNFVPWHDRGVYYYDDEESDVVYEDDYQDEAETIYLNRRKRWQNQREEADVWWLEDDVYDALENRAKARKRANLKAEEQFKKKPVVKKLAAKPKAKDLVKPAAPKLQTASLEPEVPVLKVKPKADVKKPVVAKPIATKTIGCTAGAAVVTSYGFGEVKPKACSGNTYAYTAARAGKLYELKLTAASGEIIDVKKLN